jgi:hypothetical protein
MEGMVSSKKKRKEMKKTKTKRPARILVTAQILRMIRLLIFLLFVSMDV